MEFMMKHRGYAGDHVMIMSEAPGDWTRKRIQRAGGAQRPLEDAWENGVEASDALFYVADLTQPDMEYEKGREGVEMIQQLVRQGAEVNAVDDEDRTPLHYVSASQEFIQALLAAGADVNAVNGKGETPLMCTAAEKSLRNERHVRMRTLIEAGVAINAQDMEGNTIMHRLVMGGDDMDERERNWVSGRDKMELLLAAGADLEIRNLKGWTVLETLLINNRSRFVEDYGRWLVEQGVSPEVGCDGVSGLYGQGHSGSYSYFPADVRVRLLRWLIDAGADVNRAEPGTGETWLHRLCGLAPIRDIEMLVEAGASLNALDADGETPLMSLMRRSPSLGAAAVLLDAGADCRVVARDGTTALGLVKAMETEDRKLQQGLIELLEEYGAEPVTSPPALPETPANAVRAGAGA